MAYDKVKRAASIKRYRDGLAPERKDAARKSAREWFSKHPRRAMWARAKQRARAANIPFNIEERDIVIPEFCPILGLKLEPGVGRVNPNSPSLDRIRSSEGYIKGNVWVISFKANTIKNDATLGELESIVSALKKIV